jgi:hypothetical protein
LDELQVYDMNLETAKYDHSYAYPQKVSSEQPFPVAGRFWQSISAGV